VTVPPTDATIFSAQEFAFAENNEAFVTTILGRSLSDGGGNTFYNLAPPGGPNARGWIELEGSYLDPAGFRVTAGGIQGGADADLGAGARLGGAVGYESDRLTDSLGGSGTENIVRVSVYASETIGDLGLSAALSYDYGQANTDRPSGVGPAFSSHHSDELSGAVQASTSFEAGGVLFTPAAGVLIDRQDSSSFVEVIATSPAFAVSGVGQGFDAVSPFAKLGISRAYDAGNGLTLTPDAEIGYRYDAGAAGERFTLTAADGTVFGGNQVGLDRNSAIAGASFTAHQGQLTFFFKYRASIADNWTWQSVTAGFRLAF
jgi:hypothetical protein